jgi:hypothetical protein
MLRNELVVIGLAHLMLGWRADTDVGIVMVMMVVTPGNY